MLIGLCAECDAHVVLRDSKNYEALETVIAKGSSKAAHGLPTWQSVQIKKSLSTNNIYVIIQVIPKLNTPSSNPLWAIANVRRCPIKGKNSYKICQKFINAKYLICMFVEQL